MAAYAALVSVMNIIETIQNHPRPPISFDKDQLKSLTENVTFLQEFLETHSVDDDRLESRIADAAYGAEDVIESHIVDQIEASKTISFADFYDGLHKVIQGLDLIQRDMKSFAKKTGIKDDDDDNGRLLHNNYSLRTSQFSTGQETAVGLDNVVVEVMNKLTWNQSNLQIIPIAGMGGIGKTTLANNIYINPLIVQYFDLRGWATISQEYYSKEILLELLICLNMGSRTSLSEMSEDELGNKLYKSLFGRKYLIVLDDIWSIEAWDNVKTFFPDNNGSAIMLTTRLSNLAFQISGSCFEMSFLDEDKSWNLFCKSTFGEESCPRELEDIGKKIVENCKGLPLSIVVVGGLLAKSKRTPEYWQYIVENLNSIVNLEYDKHCLKILHLSYKELPVHLKPCFLYMGVFPEDHVIYVADLMRVWVAEGFLKPIGGRFPEEVAKECFNDLLDRNLILVEERGYRGETISCKVHDLLVDLCVKEGHKHKFLCVAKYYNFSNPQDINTQRRIIVHSGAKPDVIHALASHGTLVRSLTFKSPKRFPKSFDSTLLLRVYNRFSIGQDYAMWRFVEITKGIVNCRYIYSFVPIGYLDYTPPYSVFSLWNLQTLRVRNFQNFLAASEFWQMSQIRHVHINLFTLPDPPPTAAGEDDIVLGNLQTLTLVQNFKFSDDVVKRIPNVKDLGVTYWEVEDWSSCCLNNLVQLHIESLYFGITDPPSEVLEMLSFPISLKELTLKGTELNWGDLGTNIGSLPHLQVLKLWFNSLVGDEWETVEGQFRSLKYLEISHLPDLMYWRTESWTHFPCLEHLSLNEVTRLKEIPSEIGESIKSIEMRICSYSAIISAKEIVKEQEGFGNEGLQVKVQIEEKNPDVESLADPNFLVQIL